MQLGGSMFAPFLVAYRVFEIGSFVLRVKMIRKMKIAIGIAGIAQTQPGQYATESPKNIINNVIQIE